MIVATEEQILGSDLADSTVHGTGFGHNNSQAAEGYLQGLPLLVQAIAFTEIVQPHKPRMFKLKLSDGDKVRDAFAIAWQVSASHSLDFDDIQLGFKVSSNYRDVNEYSVAKRI